MHVRKDDIVVAVSGVKDKDKNQKGKVLSVNTKKERVVVEGINIRKKHFKPTKQDEQAAIIDMEGSLHVSNVLLYCPKCDKGVRTGIKILENGRKVRYCKKCGEVLDK